VTVVLVALVLMKVEVTPIDDDTPDGGFPLEFKYPFKKFWRRNPRSTLLLRCPVVAEWCVESVTGDTPETLGGFSRERIRPMDLLLAAEDRLSGKGLVGLGLESLLRVKHRGRRSRLLSLERIS
jgi:hypothetical protein